MSDAEQAQKMEHLRRCRQDFEYFAKHHLKILDKNEELVPFILNKAQKYALSQFEDQLSRTGMVRKVILKGRQQGVSTLSEALFYWKTSLHQNRKAYILSHEQTSSDTIFGMVDRYHRHNPTPPATGASNKKELVFEGLGSKYTVATAGAKAGGRGQMSSLFHGSEVAFWPNAGDHFASSVQTVPTRKDTWILLESTANGAAGEFYERWQDATRGEDADGNPTDYEPLFIPWFWQDEYERAVDDTFELRDEPDDSGTSEREYAEMYGLSNEKMAWRRAKIAELRDPAKFRQEYPADSSEAFIASSDESYIKPADVLRARKGDDIIGYGPVIMGADPAGAGGDRFAVALRQGTDVRWVKSRNKVDAVEAAHWVRDLAVEHNPDVLFVDAGGLGQPIVSMLRTFPETVNIVRGINFGGRSEHKTAKPKIPGPVYRRDEMWQRLGEWLQLEDGVSLPDIDELTSDMTAVKVKPMLNNDFRLESKQQMRDRGVRSPDLADAVALTFASLRYIPVENRPLAKAKRDFNNDLPTDPATEVSAEMNFGSHDGWMA